MSQPNNSGDPSSAPTAGDEPFFPPESARFRIGDGPIDWSDLNAVYERDDSLKENTNPKSKHLNPNPNSSTSQRFSGNLKPTAAPIIGLPGSSGGYLGGSARRPASVRIFPRKVKTGGGGRKSAVPEAEPGSPKVSCIGKVLSDRERRRWRSRKDADNETFGFCGGFLFRCTWSRKTAVGSVETSPPKRDRVPARLRATVVSGDKVAVAPAAPAPELGGLKKFASGRKTEAWAAEIDAVVVNGHVEKSGALHRDEGLELAGSASA